MNGDTHVRWLLPGRCTCGRRVWLVRIEWTPWPSNTLRSTPMHWVNPDTLEACTHD